MKKSLQKSILFLCVLFLSIFARGETPSGQIDQIVAIVNSDVITESELNKEFVQVKTHVAQQTPIRDEQELRKQVLNQLIDQSVELQTAKKAGIDVDDHELDQAITEITERNHMTLEQLKQKIQAENLNFDDYRATIRKQMIIEKLLQHEVRPRISISKQEVDKYLHSYAFEQQNISEYLIEDILIRLPEIPSSQQLHDAQQQAKQILDKLQHGENFESLAITYSNGNSALQGGSLGWRRLEEIPSVFAEQIRTMQINKVAGPIQTSNGLHIIKLLDTRNETAHHYTQETHVRHILLKPTARKTNDELQAELISIRKQLITKKNDFSQLAEKFSEDRVSAKNGGDLGWINGDEMVPPFTAAMEKLTIGEISTPVKTQFGWHLIQVLERRKIDDTAAFQQRQIEKMLYERNFQEKTLSFIQRMRDVSYVNILLSDNTQQIPSPRLA
jgi:peptidyl-prolyl cis-trans isomerase SurA